MAAITKVSDREKIFDGESPALSLAICMSDCSHQKMGIEKEDYEAALNGRPPNRRQFSGLLRIRRHRPAVAKNR
jgi:hypothetical protein